jgi:hypothetical protein
MTTSPVCGLSMGAAGVGISAGVSATPSLVLRGVTSQTRGRNSDHRRQPGGDQYGRAGLCDDDDLVPLARLAGGRIGRGSPLSAGLGTTWNRSALRRRTRPLPKRFGPVSSGGEQQTPRSAGLLPWSQPGIEPVTSCLQDGRARRARGLVSSRSTGQAASDHRAAAGA